MADCNVAHIPEQLEHAIPRLQSLNISNWPIGESSKQQKGDRKTATVRVADALRADPQLES